MSKIDVTTFGCRLNIFESEVMRTHAARAGIEDVVIIHSCAVTSEAERQVRQAIRRAAAEHPGKRVVVTGCAVQINPERYRAMAEVDHIIDNQQKLKLETWTSLAAREEPPAIQDIMQVRETAPHLLDGFEGRTRAYLQVQNGCDHRCTFCIIPFGRGNSRSVAPQRIIDQARKLVESGFAEIVITGVDITSYGKDLDGSPELGSMLKSLLQEVPELPRLRLSSIDPAEVDDDLLDLVANEPRLMPHLHLSMQAGHDMILKRMKRRHSRGQALALARHLRELRPGIALGADLIAGFPTETAVMFQASRDFIDEADLVHLHVFPFSPREGTPAARMPQLEKAERKARARALREAGAQRHRDFLNQQIGHAQKVLVERNGGGLAENFAACRIAGGNAAGDAWNGAGSRAGRVVDFQPESVVDGFLEGTFLQ